MKETIHIKTMIELLEAHPDVEELECAGSGGHVRVKRSALTKPMETVQKMLEKFLEEIAKQ